MNIFVVNSGSSSIKYQLFKMPAEKPICTGLVERIGLADSVITHKIFSGNDEPKIIKQTLNLPNHEAGLKEVVALLSDKEFGVIQNPDDIQVVGHRAVHGGEAFASTTIITDEVKAKIKELFALAPLHNPPNYTGIEVAEKIFTKATQVAVFDTAFHQTLAPKAYRFAIPNRFYQEDRIRAYGFHGSSHKYVSEQAIQYLQKPDAKIITIHLGNGSSMAAVKAGKSIDVSMGLGPMGGLIMGTRCGDLDPSVIFHLLTNGYTPEKLGNILNKESGMLGLTGFSDMRDIIKAIKEGNEEAKLAYEMYAYRIKKYIGSYAAVLNGIDAIVFTAGIGENDADIRFMSCSDLDYLGIIPDAEKNAIRKDGIREIQKDGAPVKILIIPTNEELEIAKQCYALLN